MVAAECCRRPPRGVAILSVAILSLAILSVATVGVATVSLAIVSVATLSLAILSSAFGMPQIAPRRETAVDMSSEKRVSHRKEAHLVRARVRVRVRVRARVIG